MTYSRRSPGERSNRGVTQTAERLASRSAVAMIARPAISNAASMSDVFSDLDGFASDEQTIDNRHGQTGQRAKFLIA